MTATAAPLLAVIDELGIDRATLESVDTAYRLAGTFAIPGAAAARLTSQVLDALASEYGDTVELTFKIGQLDEFRFAGTYDTRELALFLSAAATTPRYDLVIHVNKARLIERLLGATPECEVALYFTAASAATAFSPGIQRFEQEVWRDTARRLLILVLDHDVCVRGDSLSILGGGRLEEAAAESVRAPIDAPAMASAARRRDDCIGWDTEFVSSLTPWHFAYASWSGDSTLAGYVDASFVLLSLLFTCDRARATAEPGGAPRIRAEFRGREHVAFVPAAYAGQLEGLSAEQRGAIRGLLDWCYQTQTDDLTRPDWLVDRLPFAQMRVAQALEGRPEADRFPTFATAMPEIYEGARWHWRAFLEGRVSEYLNRVEQLEGTVAASVEAYADRTASLVKGVSDTILAAVAVLIGSFIAAAFKSPFDETLFRIGILTYAAYVALFPGVLGLLSNSGQAREAKLSFEARRLRFEEALYPEKVTEIIGVRVSGAASNYRRWLFGVAACYSMVVLVAIVGAWIIPRHVGSASVVTTTPSTLTRSPSTTSSAGHTAP